VAIIAVIISCARNAAGANVVLLQSTIVDSNALNFASGSATTFANNINGRTYQQQNAVSTFNGWQYTTYYDADRHVCLGRRQLPDGAWEVIRFMDYFKGGYDSHNVVTFGICAGDGSLHLAFDHHGSTLHYRASVPGVATSPESTAWNASLFGPVTNRLGSAGTVSSVTYPRFFNAPKGNLMLYYRNGGSGSGDGMIQEYNRVTHDWTPGLGEFISRSGTYNGALSVNSTSRNPYLTGIYYGGNRIHVSWGWRESAGGSQYNHDLCYAYSDDDGRAWHNNAGALIGTTGSTFINLTTPGLVVVAIPQNEGLSNQYTEYAYPDGSCHVMLQRNGAYLHCWRTAAGVWNSVPLSFNGSRPKLVGDSDGNLFLVYVSGSTLRIAKGVPNAGQTAWTWSSVYTQGGMSEAGEGLLDSARWESERILSVYGQEEPSTILDYGTGAPIEGLPSPLHVLDYQVSSRAILPRPLHQSSDVAPNTKLQWTPGLNALAHQVYWGTNLTSVTAATTNSPEYQGQQAASLYQPSSLSEDVTYFWRIDVVQSGGTVVPGTLWQFKTTNSAVPVASTLLGDVGDTDIRSDLVLIAANGTTLIPGGSGSAPAKNRASVFVFQLPELGVRVNPFLTASFVWNYEVIGNTPPDLDLYGLDRRVSPAVLTNDYYGETAVLDSNATLIQTSILTATSPTGLQTNSSAALLNYLNVQYTDGAGAGQYVFLRFSTDASIGGAIKRYYLTSSDGGVAGPTDTRPRVNFTVAPANTPPVLTAVSNQTLIAGQTLNITNTATDSDVPAQALTFSLLAPPSGATIDPSKGVFTWRPTIAQSPATNPMSVKVTDDGSPNLSATNTFTVTVLRPAKPGISASGLSGGQFQFSIAGDSGPDYVIQASTNLTTWLPVWTNSMAMPPFRFTDLNAASFNQRFYRVLLGP